MARTNALAQKTWVEHNIKGKSSSKSELCHDLNEENKDFKKSFTKTKTERKIAFQQKFNVESNVS